MNKFEWIYFVLGFVTWQIIKMFAKAINQAVIDYRHKRFLKLVNVKFPDHSGVTFISVDSSDKRSLQKVERQIRERFGIPGEEKILNGFDEIYREEPLP